MIIKQAYIRILDTASDGEGNTYNDWRYSYIGRPGVIAICEADSADQAGNSWICFFPPEPLGAYLRPMVIFRKQQIPYLLRPETVSILFA